MLCKCTCPHVNLFTFRLPYSYLEFIKPLKISFLSTIFKSRTCQLLKRFQKSILSGSKSGQDPVKEEWKVFFFRAELKTKMQHENTNKLFWKSSNFFQKKFHFFLLRFSGLFVMGGFLALFLSYNNLVLIAKKITSDFVRNKEVSEIKYSVASSEKIQIEASIKK